jgi:hypothetical protein
MEPEGSLPCSQEPTIGLHPEPDESSPYQSTLSLWLLYTINLPPVSMWGGGEKTKTNKPNSVVSVRQRTIPTERPPLVSKISARFSG